ncbi:MAG: transcription-repair coupling factor [Nitrospirae bacterium]|nr:transcription-repair coupling factor [Nitrospirota bacterium]
MPLNLSIFYNAVRAIEEGKVKYFTSLTGSSKALLFALIKESCIVITASESSAGEFYSDAVFWSASFSTEKPLYIPPEGDPLRLKNLWDIYKSPKTKIVTSVNAVLSPVWHLDKFPLTEILKHSTIDRDIIIENLKDAGYRQVTVVSSEGEFSIRGGILDVFPPEEEFPVRIEFWGDEIESLRFFDTDTQRSIKEIDKIFIGPATEPEEGPNLLDVLSRKVLVLNEPDDIKRQYSDLLLLNQDKKIINLTSLPLKGEGFDFNIRGTGGFGILREERKTMEDFVIGVDVLKNQYFIMMVCSSEGQAKRLKELFSEKNIETPILPNDNAVKHNTSPVITIGELSRGYSYENNLILTEKDIFGERPAFKPIKKSKVSGLISSIEDFNEGDYLVHAQHGIGRFLGIKKQKVEDYEGDFIIIEYCGGDKLYIPLERIDEVQKYRASEGTSPKIDRLGGKTWLRTKQRVKNRIKDMAEKLLKLYARRSEVKGHSFPGDTELHKEFDGFFPYEETPDQLAAIIDIKRDMEEPAPMDRLICGDVGYGKTEVAIRACFKAVYDSKQAAVLAPTTILVEQHCNTFASRFSAFPVKIDFLSRFKNKAEQKQTLKALAEGNIDIIIGTHSLLVKDVNFYDLGLLVIDEEHRFGVTHKEKIKTLKTHVDVLTLTATPIPRTLHMALSGIRPMSVIETPPEDRLSVKSFVARFSPEIIREALQKELDRGGQAFFVHNRIEDIYNMANSIRKLLPESKISVAHGQMRERELENVMRTFMSKKSNILVSTAIIGSGLDIPTANTIIINRADKFGLADLYQLRGRVGRSNIRAYAYFLIPGEDIITEEARKKLLAIQELSYLGAGFRLALKDLELRGAGNMLGSEQSGHIEAVGFDLYVEMLEQTIAELKGEEAAPVIEPVLELRITAMVPETYIEDPTVRLSIYRKIASAKKIDYLRGIFEELKDRFGQPPEETVRLLDVMELKLMAKKLGITKIQNIEGRIKIVFAPQSRLIGITPQKIFELYKSRKGYIKFLPEGGFELDLRDKHWQKIFSEIKDALTELTPHI